MGLDRLLEDRFTPAVLLAHGLGRGFHVAECFWLHGGRMGNDSLSFRINLQDSIAAGACHFEILGLLRHFSESYRKIGIEVSERAVELAQLDRENVEDVEHLPSQQEDCEHDDEHRHEFTKGEAAASGATASRGQAENVERGETEHYAPEHVVGILGRAPVDECGGYPEKRRGGGSSKRIRGGGRARSAHRT
jgi:hypothetical protein